MNKHEWRQKRNEIIKQRRDAAPEPEPADLSVKYPAQFIKDQLEVRLHLLQPLADDNPELAALLVEHGLREPDHQVTVGCNGRLSSADTA